MPNLKNCSITFHTNDEDKDHDTHVTVTVTDENDLVCAVIDNDFGHFNDQSDAGPYQLVVKNPQTRQSLAALAHLPKAACRHQT